MSSSFFLYTTFLFVAGAIVVTIFVLARKFLRLRRLHQAELALLRLMIRGAPFSDKLAAICVLIEAQIDNAYASIMIVNPQTATLSCVTSPSLPADFAQQLDGLPIAEGVGACGTAAARNEPVIVEDMLTHEHFLTVQDMVRKYQLRACWSHPFASQQGDVAGTFAVYFRQPRLPTRHELSLIQQARDWVALVLQQQHEQERREASEAQMLILQRGIEASANGIVIADARQPGNPLVYINPAFAQITGWSQEEMLGQSCRVLQGEGTDPRAIEQIRSRLRRFKEVQTVIRNYKKDGTPFWNDLYIAPVKDAQGVVTHFIGVQNDISDRKKQEERIAWHANHDSLTELPNRALLADRLDQALRFVRRYHLQLTVMFIDLDGFKPINDTLGHAVGDKVLKVVAQRLSQSLRDGDTLARFGGDEFVIVLPNAGNVEEVNSIAERLLVNLSEPYEIDDKALTLTASIGIAQGNEEIQDPNILVQQADMAMYKAKRRGHHNFEWFSHDINSKVERHVVVRHEIQEALANDEFRLVYQPIFNAQQQIASVEALLRWQHPVQGEISPAEFIPIAEHTGQIIPLGRWVIEQVCRDIGRFRQLGIEKVSVNLSPIQLSRSRFVEDLEQILEHYHVSPAQLMLEITENVLVNELTHAPELLQTLHDKGFTIALDDFGSGYSSLRYLHELPIDVVKIDRVFTGHIGGQQGKDSIVRAMLAIAAELELQVIAEGIETAEQLEFLRDKQCNGFQGFYLARPVAIEQFIHLLESPPKSG